MYYSFEYFINTQNDEFSLEDIWTRPGIGIDWLWRLSDKHPFFAAACYHDSMWDLRNSGRKPYSTSYEIDKEFLRRCLEAAKKHHSFFLKCQAYFFYGLCRAWGKKNW